MYGYKSKRAYQFKTVELVADSHQFKTIHRLYKKKFFHKATYLPAFAFSMESFLVEIKSKIAM